MSTYYGEGAPAPKRVTDIGALRQQEALRAGTALAQYRASIPENIIIECDKHGVENMHTSEGYPPTASRHVDNGATHWEAWCTFDDCRKKRWISDAGKVFFVVGEKYGFENTFSCTQCKALGWGNQLKSGLGFVMECGKCGKFQNEARGDRLERVHPSSIAPGSIVFLDPRQVAVPSVMAGKDYAEKQLVRDQKYFIECRTDGCCNKSVQMGLVERGRLEHRGGFYGRCPLCKNGISAKATEIESLAVAARMTADRGSPSGMASLKREAATYSNDVSVAPDAKRQRTVY